ncbi:hypothetical protein [Kitasatospora sp. NPDC017646]|uniref:hypothetical protein n=1 Tax=Kitasatospora sp. NPDC017646 TaxID=3364024 RepID=UPI00378BF43F
MNPHHAIPLLLDPPVETAHPTGPRDDTDAQPAVTPVAPAQWPPCVLGRQTAQAVGSGAGAAGPV